MNEESRYDRPEAEIVLIGQIMRSSNCSFDTAVKELDRALFFRSWEATVNDPLRTPGAPESAA